MYNLLIVDDERIERIALKMYFDQSAKTCKICHEAKNGQEAIQMVNDYVYDVILMDIRMPGEDGLTIAKAIKKTHPDIRIIMLTAYADFDFAVRAIKFGADDYLLKPTRPHEIEKLIENILKQSRVKGQDSHVLDHFIKELISAKYFNTVKAFNHYIENRSQDTERQVEETKEILEGILRLIENYNLKMDETNIARIKRIKNSYYDTHQLWQLVQEIVHHVFAEIISNKYCRHDQEIHYALDFIEFNLKEKLTLERISSYMNISPQYFSRLFKQEMKVTFVQYLSERRIEQAKKEIVYTNKSLGVIGHDLMFNEANYFSKVFKRCTGMSPSQYRSKVESEMIEKSNVLQKNYQIINTHWKI